MLKRHYLLILTLLFNYIDGILTYHYVTSGRGKELNPIIDYLLANDYITLFVLYKFVLPTLLIGIILSFKKPPSAIYEKIPIILVFIVYSLLMIWWLVSIFVFL